MRLDDAKTWDALKAAGPAVALAAIDANPDDPVAPLRRAEALMSLGDADNARAALEQFSGSAGGLLARGLACKLLAHDGSHAAVLSETSSVPACAGSLDVEGAVHLHEQRANALFGLGAFREAVEAYVRAEALAEALGLEERLKSIRANADAARMQAGLPPGGGEPILSHAPVLREHQVITRVSRCLLEGDAAGAAGWAARSSDGAIAALARATGHLWAGRGDGFAAQHALAGRPPNHEAFGLYHALASLEAFGLTLERVARPDLALERLAGLLASRNDLGPSLAFGARVWPDGVLIAAGDARLAARLRSTADSIPVFRAREKRVTVAFQEVMTIPRGFALAVARRGGGRLPHDVMAVPCTRQDRHRYLRALEHAGLRHECLAGFEFVMSARDGVRDVLRGMSRDGEAGRGG